MNRERIIAIGDIHGCLKALEALLSELQVCRHDTVVVLGDIIDRGPSSCGVVERLKRLSEECRLITLMGNHEEMFLQALEDIDRQEFWLQHGGKEMLESYGVEDVEWRGADMSAIPTSHIDFIRSFRLYFETDDCVFVHAGVAPNLPLSQQSTLDLLWRPLEEERLYPHYSGKTVVVGHTPQPSGQVLDRGFLKCIDTGCHFGGRLTAYEPATGLVWQADEEGCRWGPYCLEEARCSRDR